MKALTDKIIDKLESLIKDDKTSEFSKGIQQSIIEIKKLEESSEFEEIARVMMKHLGTRTDIYHPHMKVIIESDRAELVEGVKSTGINFEYIQD